MSTDFGSVWGTDSPDPVMDRILVNRFWGGPRGACVQLTIGERYVQLDAHGVHMLIEKLARTQYATSAEADGLSFIEQEADRNARSATGGLITSPGSDSIPVRLTGCLYEDPRSPPVLSHHRPPPPPRMPGDPMTPDEVVTRPSADLVDVQPTPVRIVDGQRYADNEGRLYEGDADGGLWELAAGYVDAGEVEEIDGLHVVKVVPA